MAPTVALSGKPAAKGMSPEARSRGEGEGARFASDDRGPSILTRPLGLEGWAHLEPVLLAALASEEPMLLIGRHGTAKSFLLERLAEAMGLHYRFYNASLIDFDDLVGIPVPTDDQQALRYIHTPTAIWDAEVVFIDEINRTKPELQNKLFPIIHERRVQGVRLESLRYRWAAMNPAACDDDAEDEPAYLGAEPLDPALADRFTYLITVPTWDDLTATEKQNVLLDQFKGRHEFALQVPDLVDDAAALYAGLQGAPPAELCGYVDALANLLNRPTPVLSARRATMLFRSTLAIQAARTALALRAGAPVADIDWDASAFLSILHGHPSLAQHGRIDRAALLAAHREAWAIAGMAAGDPWKRILQEVDPVERLALALQFEGAIEGDDLGRIISDVIASESDEGRRTALALAVYLAARSRAQLPAGTMELIARDVRCVLVPADHELLFGPSQVPLAREVGRVCSALQEGDERDAYTRNLLNALLPDGYRTSGPQEIAAYFRSLWGRLVVAHRRPGPPSSGDEMP